MKRFLIILTAFALVAAGTAANAAGKKVINRVSVGGADICEAVSAPTGCNANFSLVAVLRDDASVAGQWQDTLGRGDGINVAIDCLNVVDVGGGVMGAVLAGVITHGSIGGVDLSGLRAITAVVDNGTSANDPQDQISFSFIENSDCTAFVPDDFPLFALTHGQVKVR